MDSLSYGVVQRPKAGREVCGDAWQVLPGERGTLVAVADGLGSGPAAAEAARAAMRTIAEHAAAPLLDLMERCNEALRGTRGAAIALLLVRPGRRIEAVSVGNVEVRARREVEFALVPTSGIVGANYRPPRVATGEWPPGEWLVMHSDGLRAGIDLDAELMHAAGGPQEFAEQLAAAYGRADDDLTVLVLELA